MAQKGDQIKLGPWPAGINNRAHKYELPEGAVVDALNVDITSSGRILRRKGTTQLLTSTSAHSAFGGSVNFLFMEDGELHLGLPGDDSVLRSGMSARRVAYIEVNGDIYYSNGEVTGKVRSDGTHTTWGVPTPSSQPTIAAVAAGGMYAGRYQIGVTFEDSYGEVSGALAPQAVDVAAGGGILVTNIPQSTDASYVSLYVTEPNGDKLYEYVTIPMGLTTQLVAASANKRGLLTTVHHEPFPPCDMLTYYNGRIYGVKDNVAWYTNPLMYGLVDYSLGDNFILFPEDVTVFAPTVDGIYVCSDKTYFLAGKGPADFSLQMKSKARGVYRTQVDIENTDNVAWFGELGWAIGKPGGNVEFVSDPNVAVPYYESGVSLFRQQRGIRQLVCALRGSSVNDFTAGDYADAATVRSE